METKKVAMFVGGAVVFCVVACCTPLVWELRGNLKTLKKKDTPELKKAAVLFAKRGTHEDCETETIRRFQACLDDSVKAAGGIVDFSGAGKEAYKDCGPEVLLFHGHCLDAAKYDASFCGRARGKGPLELRTWSGGECRKIGLGSHDDCAHIYRTTALHCVELEERPEGPTAEQKVPPERTSDEKPSGSVDAEPDEPSAPATGEWTLPWAVAAFGLRLPHNLHSHLRPKA